MQKKADNEMLEAKKNVSKNKRGTVELTISTCGLLLVAALFALKKKKVYEGQIDKLQGARMTMFVGVFDISEVF